VSVLPDLRRALTLDWKKPGDLVYLLGETRAELGGSEFYEMLGYVGLSVPEVRVAEFLPYYRLLEQAIEDELLASCHGLYRGGLGVGLAMASLASGLGLDADLSKIAADSPAYAALYAESAGRFLISVAAEHQSRLEPLFAGQPLIFLGKVREDNTFKVTRSGKTLIKTSLDQLQAAWQRRFGNLV
jgi:phosphoribosylformylglycinamidine synthase